MNITINSRQVEVTDDLKLLFEKKLSKFDKFFDDDTIAYITLSRNRNLEKLELTISNRGTLYRCEKENSTFNNALDEVMDAIDRQIRKNKTRLEKRLREGAFIKDDTKSTIIGSQIDEEPEFRIREKTFTLKPMSPEEAILQMNLLGHEFFVFENDKTAVINVVYRRNDKNYGIIIPEK
jgi:putative sigma-54 modulation protein